MNDYLIELLGSKTFLIKSSIQRKWREAYINEGGMVCVPNDCASYKFLQVYKTNEGAYGFDGGPYKFYFKTKQNTTTI